MEATRQYGFKGVESLRQGDLIAHGGEVLRLLTGPYVAQGGDDRLSFGAVSPNQGVIGVTLDRAGTVPVHCPVSAWQWPTASQLNVAAVLLSTRWGQR